MNVRCVLAITLTSVVVAAHGHGVPTVIPLSDDGMSLVAPSRAGVVVLTGGANDSDEPGFGLGPAASAPPVGTHVGLETAGGLLYWDGLDIAATDATLTIEAPDFDHFGVPNTSEVAEYVVAANSDPMTGLSWSVFGGGDFWHANGFFMLDGPKAGVYGVPIRIVTMPGGAQLGPTEPFLLPVFYDPFSTWTVAEALEGIEALEAALVQPADFNSDGSIDSADYGLWSTNYATAPPTTGDANGDGLVDAADYTVWRDAAKEAAVTIPEPHTLSILVAATLLTTWRPRSI